MLTVSSHPLAGLEIGSDIEQLIYEKTSRPKVTTNIFGVKVNAGNRFSPHRGNLLTGLSLVFFREVHYIDPWLTIKEGA